MADLGAPDITLLSEFRDRGLEHRFRQEHVGGYKRVNYLMTMPILLAAILFSTNDIIQETFDWAIVGPRILMSVLILVGCYLNHRTLQWQRVFIISYVIVALVVPTVAWVDYQRPPDFLVHLGVDIVVIMGAYFCLPTIRAQLTTAITFTIYLLGLHFLVKEPDLFFANYSVPISLVVANVLGVSMSVLYNRTQRQLYAQLLYAQSMYEDLRQTRSKVEAMTTLIPMCSHCRKIKDDGDQWTALESYMQKLSGSKVSHGICPDCERRFREELPSR